MHRDDKLIEQKLNSNFLNICNWFVDNYLRLYFGKIGLKVHCLAQKRLKKQVTNLGFILDENLS